MTPEQDRHQRVSELFASALSKTGDDRARFLQEQCAGDAALLEEVQELLEIAETATRLPGTGAGLTWTPPAAIPERIAHYSVKAVLGEGGMGRVFLAIQDRPRRAVAVKVLRPGLVSRTAARRFEIESEILGRLRHPGIAQVFEAGVDSNGAAFIAMEFIPAARTLTEYAETHPLTLKEKVELFAKVCDAVQHAHQNAVIHRDLKPANIIVDKAGEPRVIDFGVAAMIDAEADRTRMTQAGEQPGTPDYMSPEQCGLEGREIDTRSDIYSLGVILYELLCRQLPHHTPSANRVQIARRIAEVPPCPPSTHDGRLRGPLQAVMLKALAKEPKDRYPSASEFAADLRRWRRGEPVSVHRPTPWLRVARWVGRHPRVSAVVGTVLLCAAIAGGSLATVWWYNSRPAHIRFSDNHTVADLESHSGRSFWRLEGNGKPIDLMDIVRRPAAPGYGKAQAVLITFAPSAIGNEGRRNELEVRDAVVPANLIWSTASLRPYVPPSTHANYKNAKEGAFVLSRAILADVLPEPYGSPAVPEIVLLAHHEHIGACCLRVLTLWGTIKAEAWHNGWLTDICWLPPYHGQPGILALSGANNDRSLKDLGLVPPRPELTKYFPGRNGWSGWRQVVIGLNVTALTAESDNDIVSGAPWASWYKHIDPPELCACLKDPRLYVRGFEPATPPNLTVCLDLMDSERSTIIHLGRNGDVLKTVPNDAWTGRNDAALKFPVAANLK